MVTEVCVTLTILSKGGLLPWPLWVRWLCATPTQACLSRILTQTSASLPLPPPTASAWLATLSWKDRHRQSQCRPQLPLRPVCRSKRVLGRTAHCWWWSIRKSTLLWALSRLPSSCPSWLKCLPIRWWLLAPCVLFLFVYDYSRIRINFYIQQIYTY